MTNALRPIVLIHGYSAQGSDFQGWRNLIPTDTFHVHIGDYVSLTNEVTIKDIAEGFDRALDDAQLTHKTFDAIVHSTGMLVLRCWLTTFPHRAERLKHLIGLAPATNGSPLAHKGRGWLGAVFKGNKKCGPDFLEAGDEILSALELGSQFTWDLAGRDLFADTVYGPTEKTPYVFVFCGIDDYDGFRGLVNEPGTDGTVRWAGCALNSRKITLDLTRPGPIEERATLLTNNNIAEIPLVLIDKLNHETIVSKPNDVLQQLVLDALKVNNEQSYASWCERARRASATPDEEYQQFVLRLVDERGDAIPDYHVQCCRVDGEDWQSLKAFDDDVHAYGGDTSLRNFHVLLDTNLRSAPRLGIVLTASSGSPLVQYDGFGDDDRRGSRTGSAPMAATQIRLSFPPHLRAGTQQADFFSPFTTTFIELRVNREPVLGKVFSFLKV